MEMEQKMENKPTMKNSRRADEKANVEDTFADSLYYLLKGKNIDDIRVEKICEYSGLSKKSFYNHFKDKYDLAQYLYDKLIEQAISVRHYYMKLAEGDEELNNIDMSSVESLRNIFFSLRNTHKDISDNLVLSNDYNSPQNYFDRQSISGRKKILLKRLSAAGKKLDDDELELAGKMLYMVSAEYFKRWDSQYGDDLPVEEVEKLVNLTNGLIDFFVQRASEL